MLDGSRFQKLMLSLWIICLLLLALVSSLAQSDIDRQLERETLNKGVRTDN